MAEELDQPIPPPDSEVRLPDVGSAQALSGTISHALEVAQSVIAAAGKELDESDDEEDSDDEDEEAHLSDSTTSNSHAAAADDHERSDVDRAAQRRAGAATDPALAKIASDPLSFRRLFQLLVPGNPIGQAVWQILMLLPTNV